MTVAEIIHSCILEKEEGQRALVLQYAPLLMTVSRRYSMVHYGPEDILQDAFINIFKNISQFDESRGSFEGWMKRITINTALKEIRKNRISFTNDLSEERKILSVDPDVYSQLGAEQLMAFIKELPEKYQLVFNLNVVEGYSHSEIADLLEIEVASSRSNLSRAKSILRENILKSKVSKSWVRTG